MGKRRGGGLQHRGGRARGARHGRHPHAEGERGRHGRGRRSRVLRRVPDRIRPEEPHQALQQLRALSHPDGTSRRRAELPKPEDAGDDYQPQYETLHRAGDRELHDPHLEAQEVRRHPRGIQRVLQVGLPRLRRPGAHHLAARGRRAHLRRAAVRAQPRALRPVQQGLQEGAGPVQLQRAHHGEVRGTAARLLQLRARRGGFARTSRSTSRARRCSTTAS